jgi:NADH-quinone oxidoreductase subunit E
MDFKGAKHMNASSQKIDTQKLDAIMSKYNYAKSNLIAILQAVQAEFRYLPENAIIYIGTKIEGLSPATVYGVATFYAQFSLEPKGKYEIKCCDGTACHVRGSMPVLNAIKSRLNLKAGQMTTENGLFSVETVSCLGACGLAPVLVINDKVYPQMTSDAVKIVLDTLMSEG